MEGNDHHNNKRRSDNVLDPPFVGNGTSVDNVVDTFPSKHSHHEDLFSPCGPQDVLVEAADESSLQDVAKRLDVAKCLHSIGRPG